MALSDKVWFMVYTSHFIRLCWQADSLFLPFSGSERETERVRETETWPFSLSASLLSLHGLLRSRNIFSFLCFLLSTVVSSVHSIDPWLVDQLCSVLLTVGWSAIGSLYFWPASQLGSVDTRLVDQLDSLDTSLVGQLGNVLCLSCWLGG